jgi:hypothetical protein
MVIEQYVSTTRYNFPQPSMDASLPQRFVELGLYSLRQVHTPFQINQETLQYDNPYENIPTTLHLKQQALPIKPNPEETVVAAVDTSTIKIGETRTGVVIAIRGANVWKQNRSYNYRRLGPFLFHITEDNKKNVFNALERSYFGSQFSSTHQSSPNLPQMPMRLASLLERWLQTMIARTATNGIVLFDGSLTSGTFDTPVERMREILTTARRHNNTVLAFSKATCLRANGYLITDVLPNQEPPYLLETSGMRFKPPTVLLGDVYVARLNKANLAFRLDIDREVPFAERIDALERLVGNDVFQSYPETLRLSHILCTFTANEVLAIQHFITRKHGIQILNRPDVHKLLFGPFGREGYS